MTAIKYRTADVDGLNIFYREAGRGQNAPKLLLLHGFPSARATCSGTSHPARRPTAFHIVAPDLPTAVGKSTTCRSRGHYLRPLSRKTIDRFTEVVGFDRYAVYVFDYGAPDSGFRLAVSFNRIA